MNKTLAVLCIGLAVASTPVSSDASRPEGKRLSAAAFEDACTGVPGYVEFRTELVRVAAARDGEGLRALFHPDGAMRVNSVGGRANTPDWGFSRPEAAAVWRELDTILALGCARRGERLLLPAMAYAADLQDGELVVLRDEAIRRAPDPKARALRQARLGQVFTYSVYDTPSGWTSVVLDRGIGYLPTSALRSPFAFRLELVPFEGSWRIRAFGDGV